MAKNAIQQRYNLLKSTFNERTLRLFAAAEASAIGRGGIKQVARIVGIERHAIARGIRELNEKNIRPTDRIRKAGAGRKKSTIKNTALLPELRKLVEPATRGDPELPLLYTSKSTRNISKELRAQGHAASHELVAQLLRQEKYSLQANRKTREGKSHPDRNAQFEFINQDVKKQLNKHEPVISVDTKKKELVGNFKNSGREWRPQGKPQQVNMHDFTDSKLGKVVPYGVYEIDRNHGWVNLGIDHDTAEFACESIRKWWKKTGRPKYPNAKSLTITADSGGSNSSRSRLWKFELQ
ncbi:ISAzo13 family transposase, partial [Candidatus Micrarchaeota archaeon]|nr:ISAzo13 family transposase [Candidatus Micrarchaeota archaeon]